MSRKKQVNTVLVADTTMLKKCVELLKNKNNSKREVIDILEKEVKDLAQAEKNLIN